MPKFNCKFCQKETYSKHSTAKFCSKDCGWKHQRKHPVIKGMQTLKQGLVKPSGRGKLIKNKQVYSNGLIDYPAAYNGKAYIGHAKTPLMPNSTGIGYQGVLIQDESRQYVQCSLCGNWTKHINSIHLKACNKEITTPKEYKEKFGLFLTPGLVSDETSLKLTQACLKNKSKEGLKKIMIMANSVRNLSSHKLNRVREFQNRFGTCPDQLKFRLKTFILENRELPSQGNRGKGLYKVFYRRFGGIGKAMEHYKLPSFEKIGTTYLYKFPKGEIVKFNINQFDQREELFTKIVLECDLFTEADREFYLQSVT